VPWTDEDTLTSLGLQATDASVLIAQTIIEIFAGLVETDQDADLISSRNFRLLSLATSFQAVWLDAHPEVLTNMDVDNFSQDGMSASWSHANAHLLAPLAKRCIDRLTWKLHPLRVRPSRAHTVPSDQGSRDSAVRDDQYIWTPLNI